MHSQTADLATRFPNNPLLSPADVPPTHPELKVECVLNPGAFAFENKIGLVLRIAEMPEQRNGHIKVPILENGHLKILEFNINDPDLDYSDPRVIKYRGRGYLTSLSHLRLAWSDDGVHFTVADTCITGQGPLESYGIEDCRVTQIGQTYYLTYTAVSPFGYGVNMVSTTDWKAFHRHGMILSGPNKDCALFPEPINNRYYCLHRPSMVIVGGSDIWLADSENLTHWGNHRCIAATRPGKWDCQRIGAGAAPIKTEHGWLEIYHGANGTHKYALGALLLDADDPANVIARSTEPVMEPIMDYEKNGFFNNVVFTNGHIVTNDRKTIMLYYGAADRYVCGATLKIDHILDSLNR